MVANQQQNMIRSPTLGGEIRQKGKERKRTMTQQEGIVKGDSFQKMGSVGFLIGAVLIIVGNSWVATIDLSNPLVAQARMSGQLAILDTVTLMLTCGWYALLTGAAAVRRSIKTAGAAWATMGFYFWLVGAAVWTVGMSLDITASALISNWLSASAANREAAHGLLTTLFPPGLGFGRGLFPLEILVNWLAIAFLGTGMLRSVVYPRWLGGSGLMLGIIGIGFGFVMTYIGREAVFTPFTVLAFVTLLWLLACGIWMARRAW
jgi:hypothetical protein